MSENIQSVNQKITVKLTNCQLIRLKRSLKKWLSLCNWQIIPI